VGLGFSRPDDPFDPGKRHVDAPRPGADHRHDLGAGTSKGGAVPPSLSSSSVISTVFTPTRSRACTVRMANPGQGGAAGGQLDVRSKTQTRPASPGAHGTANVRFFRRAAEVPVPGVPVQEQVLGVGVTSRGGGPAEDVEIASPSAKNFTRILGS